MTDDRINIALYTLIGKFERVRKALTDSFAGMTREVIDVSDEDGMESFIIRLHDGSDISINIDRGPAFISEYISAMYSFFAGAECADQKLHQSVLDQIGAFNCAAGISFEPDGGGRTDSIISAALAAAGDISGLVLMQDMRLLDSEGRLVFSAEGNSDFKEYMPIGNADFFDSRAEVSPADTARRERSFAALEEKSIPYLPNLPAAVMESEAELRPPEEIARRLFAMFGVCVYCEARDGGQTWEEAQKYLNRINDILGGGLDGALTPAEKAFLAVREPERPDIIRLGWRYECCHVLMWALGMADELRYPDRVCDVSAMSRIIWWQDSLAGFLKKAKPRARDEILDAADLILRYHWACVAAWIKGQPGPSGLDGEVVIEWHHALNWLIGWGSSAGWDDVKTHT